MSEKIRVSDVTMEVITSDVAAEPIMVNLGDDGKVKLSVGDGKIRFDEEDLSEVITVLERVRQLAGDRPERPSAEAVRDADIAAEESAAAEVNPFS